MEKEKNCSVGIAIPDDDFHKKITLKIASSLKKLNIQIYFVSENGNVDVE